MDAESQENVEGDGEDSLVSSNPTGEPPPGEDTAFPGERSSSASRTARAEETTLTLDYAKHYCCRQCLLSARFLAAQLSETPLPLRRFEPAHLRAPHLAFWDESRPSVERVPAPETPSPLEHALRHVPVSDRQGIAVTERASAPSTASPRAPTLPGSRENGAEDGGESGGKAKRRGVAENGSECVAEGLQPLPADAVPLSARRRERQRRQAERQVRATEESKAGRDESASTTSQSRPRVRVRPRRPRMRRDAGQCGSAALLGDLVMSSDKQAPVRRRVRKPALRTAIPRDDQLGTNRSGKERPRDVRGVCKRDSGAKEGSSSFVDDGSERRDAKHPVKEREEDERVGEFVGQEAAVEKPQRIRWADEAGRNLTEAQELPAASEAASSAGWSAASPRSQSDDDDSSSDSDDATGIWLNQAIDPVTCAPVSGTGSAPSTSPPVAPTSMAQSTHRGQIIGVAPAEVAQLATATLESSAGLPSSDVPLTPEAYGLGFFATLWMHLARWVTDNTASLLGRPTWRDRAGTGVAHSPASPPPTSPALETLTRTVWTELMALADQVEEPQLRIERVFRRLQALVHTFDSRLILPPLSRAHWRGAAIVMGWVAVASLAREDQDQDTAPAATGEDGAGENRRGTITLSSTLRRRWAQVARAEGIDSDQMAQLTGLFTRGFASMWYETHPPHEVAAADPRAHGDQTGADPQEEHIPVAAEADAVEEEERKDGEGAGGSRRGRRGSFGAASPADRALRIAQAERILAEAYRQQQLREETDSESRGQ